MYYIEKSLLVLAHIFKILKLPHLLKYGLFLLIKKRRIPIRSSINISYAKMDLNLGDFIDYWIFMDGSYEGKWINAIQDLVKEKTFIDVGANIGSYPLSLYKDASFIYAFEPEEKNYKSLLHNIKINSIKNIKVIKKAVFGHNHKKIALYINKDDQGWHSLSIKYSGGIQKVESITLDYFVKQNKIDNIGLIKIDVEGAELDVLKGSLKTLKRLHPPMLIEFNNPVSEISGHNLMDLYRLMIKNHYQSYGLKGANLIKLSSSDISKIYNENILFVNVEGIV